MDTLPEGFEPYKAPAVSLPDGFEPYKGSEGDSLPSISKAETAGRALASTAAQGWQEKLSPLFESALAKMDPTMSKQNYQDMYESQPYSALSKPYFDENSAAFKANPGTAGTFGAIGNLSTSIPIQSAMTLAGVPLIAQGAVMGGINSAGQSKAYMTDTRIPAKRGSTRTGTIEPDNSETSDLGKLFLDTSAGATAGAIIAKLFSPSTLSKVAQYTGLKSSGFIQGGINKAGGIDKVNRAVQTVLDEAPSVIQPLNATGEALKDSLSGVRNQTGGVIRSTLQNLDSQGIKAMQPVNLMNEIADIDIPGQGPLIKVAQSDNSIRGFLGQAVDYLKRPTMEVVKREGSPAIESNPSATSTFDQMQGFKQWLGDRINWRDPAVSDEAGSALNKTKIAMYHRVGDLLDESISRAGEHIEDPSTFQDYMKAKRLYSASSTLTIGAKSKATREAGNNLIPLGIKGLFGLPMINSLSHGDTAGAARDLAMGMAAHGAYKYGMPLVSPLSNLASNALQTVPATTALSALGGREISNNLVPLTINANNKLDSLIGMNQ